MTADHQPAHDSSAGLAPSPSPTLQPRPLPPLHTVLPPLVLGTATFNTQYVKGDPTSPSDLPSTAIVQRALDLGVRAFDSSPYYGPSEELLGAGLAAASPPVPRDAYLIITKAGRVAPTLFDYSPAAIRRSVRRSLARLRTPYLDLVYAHDVEFVSAEEVVGAVRELRRIRDEGLAAGDDGDDDAYDNNVVAHGPGVVRYVGISGYPLPVLRALAERVRAETGEGLDAVMSYAHFTVQNETLAAADDPRGGFLSALLGAGVDVALSASMLGMGLLTSSGVDRGAMRDWHPAPRGLRDAASRAAEAATENGQSLEALSIRWALHQWARRGAHLGTRVGRQQASEGRIGVSVMGVTTVRELNETWAVWKEVLQDMQEDGADEAKTSKRHDVRELVEQKIWPAFGTWRDYSWKSPSDDFVRDKIE